MSVFVYISGPYTKGDPVQNTREAMELWDKLERLGYVPYVPHWSMFQHFLLPRSYDTWLDYDCKLLERFDVVLRMPGESSGADREVEHAAKHGIPVVHSVEDLHVMVRP